MLMTGRDAGERQGHDLRLVIPALGVWGTAWALLGATAAVAYGVAVGCGLGALPFLAGSLSRSRRRRDAPESGGAAGGALRPAFCGLAGAVLACAAAAAAGTGLRLSAVESGPVREAARAGTRAPIEAVVTGDPVVKPSERRRIVLLRARAEAIRLQGRTVRVRVPVLLIATEDAWRALVPGQRIQATARLSPPRHAELLAAVAIVRGPPVVVAEPSAVRRAAERVRASLRAACDVLAPDQRGVLPGMVVGDTSRLDPELAADFTAAGLTHLMVVSGANLAIVAGAVLTLCRLAGLGRRRAPAVAVAALPAFVVVARPEPSVLRATVMTLIGLLAFATGSRRQGLPALGGAVLVLVLIDPGLARSYGFALSVLATGGLLLLAPPWTDRLSRWLPRPVAEALAVAAAAQLACAPVLVMLTGQVGLVAVAANLLAAPAVPVAMLLGALAAVIAPLWLTLARLVVWPAGLAVGWIIGVARTAAAVPHATVPWQDGFLGAVTLTFVLVAGCLVLRKRLLLIAVAAAGTGALLAGAAARVTAPAWPPPGWAMVACDVGQGDASVLAVGKGSAVVVDAGPDPGLADACLDRLKVQTVPLLVLTHPHADHIGGTPGIRRGRTVGTVVISARSDGRESRHTFGLPLHAAVSGRQWHVGDLSLTVLAPWETARPDARPEADDEAVNNASIVLVARKPGFSALLTGDIETEAQRALIPDVPPVQVLKVPHHGARDQDPAFLAATRAAISIISAGENNDYGHPAPSTLALLQRLGTRVYRTDRHGDIAIVPTPAGPAAVPRKGG